MSSAWRDTGAILPVPSTSVIEMWSVLNANADAGGELRNPNVATSSATHHVIVRAQSWLSTRNLPTLDNAGV